MSDENQVPPAPPGDTPDDSAGAAPPPPPTGATPPPPASPPPTGGAAGPVSPNRQLWLVLSYLWVLALVPFLVEKDDKEVLWHAKHGLVLFGVEILAWIALNIVQWVVTATLGPLACLGCFAFAALGVAELVLHIVCIVKALNGERLIIPGISQLADQF